MSQANSESFIVVGIGAPADRLDALQQFFAPMRTTSGMAFAVVLHPVAGHESHMAAQLQLCTAMPVIQVTETIQLEPNRVYVIPPNHNLLTIDSHLRRSPPEEAQGECMPIDHFFCTLASTQGEHAIGILLAGAGADGTVGLRCIKEEGGLAIVEQPAATSYANIAPGSSVMGVADFILPLEIIPAQLIAYAANAARIQAAAALREGSAQSTIFQHILARLRVQTGQDFAHYNRATLVRRIRRRMQIHQIEEIANYLHFLDQHEEEVERLGEDFLISVTQFFRDPTAFAKLNQLIIPQLFTNKGVDNHVRIWVAGCATGEEAYSLAILLAEHADSLGQMPTIQIFATDINERALNSARKGFYSEAIQAQISPERLARFFIQKRGGYQVKSELRKLVIR